MADEILGIYFYSNYFTIFYSSDLKNVQFQYNNSNKIPFTIIYKDKIKVGEIINDNNFDDAIFNLTDFSDNFNNIDYELIPFSIFKKEYGKIILMKKTNKIITSKKFILIYLNL